MAKIKYSALVSEVSGKLNGSVLTKNRYGAYIRNKVTPVNRQTSAQLGVRSTFTTVAQAWRGLTQAQLAQWGAGAKNFIRTNVFGDIRNLSGFNLYMRLNKNLLNTGGAMIDVCPLPAPVESITATVLAAANGANTVTLTFADAIAAGTVVEVFATPALSAGKEFISSEYRKIATLTDADVSPKVLSAQYIAVFGNVGEVGTKISVKTKSYGAANGIPGASSQVSTLVVA